MQSVAGSRCSATYVYCLTSPQCSTSNTSKVFFISEQVINAIHICLAQLIIILYMKPGVKACKTDREKSRFIYDNGYIHNARDVSK